MKVHPRKCAWFKDEVEYLRFVINKDGIHPQNKKIEKMVALERPKTTSEVRSFLGMVNYYHHMWHQRSMLISPLKEVLNKKENHFFGLIGNKKCLRKLRKSLQMKNKVTLSRF